MRNHFCHLLNLDNLMLIKQPRTILTLISSPLKLPTSVLKLKILLLMSLT